MAKIEILMPNMGESIFECTVLKWLVKEGDRVEIDDMIIEVATDKIDTEIGSSHSGVITRFLIQEGEIAKIGSPICEIETEASAKPDPVKLAVQELETSIQKTITEVNAGAENRFYSPLVLSIAKEENISHAELEKIKGTGQNQRVTKDDILSYIASRKVPATTPSSGEDQIIEMDRMRKMIAQRMVDSKRISPHVTSFIETDMTRLAQWRNKVKEDFQKKHNENLTFTPLLIRAIVAAIQKFPAINAQVDGDNIIYKKDINIGMAVALPNGNLIVPVIHRADQYSLMQLTAKVNDLATRARNNQLKPEELVGGTYTMSNIGGFGNLAGTPIILQPQVAIMAFGVIRKMPAVIETEDGDFIGIRQKMIISHSYDHRVVDGSLGGLFLKEVSDYLEKEQSV
jgi:2-oxoglutarate dehydrogenase E2 component (dihydrolipoamide succinyltransferase)